MALQEVAGTARAGGRFAEADSLFAEAVAILRAAYPDDHPQIATVLRSWASTKQRIRQYADALALYAEVGRILRRFLPPDHAYILTNVNDLGNVHRQLGNFADAERYLRQSVRLHLDRYGDRSLMTMGAKASLGDVLEVRGKRAEEAINILRFSPKAMARDVKKVLESAIANAENNHNLDVDSLVVAEASVGKALTMKRWSPRARGRASRIVKPFSRVRIVVREASQEA